MSDNKRWFKVWSSILMDMDFLNMSLENLGRWTRLGALMASQGDGGKLVIKPPATFILKIFECNDMDVLIDTLRSIKNVTILPALQPEIGFMVVMKNWHRYQVDSSQDRVRKFREKKRRNVTFKEEKRREVTSTSTSCASHPPPFGGASATREMALSYEDLPEAERMSPDEMKAVRIKNMGGVK